MRDLTVRFEDVDPTDPYLKRQPEFFVDILRRKYHVTVLEGGTEEPDVLFFSCFGMDNVKWTRCLRIFYSAESGYPDFNMCDYAIALSNVGSTDRFLHFPHYVFYNDLLRKYERLAPEIDTARMLNRDFCSAVISNAHRDPIVFEAFNRLNAYKPIASGGRWHNTVGGPVADKLDFISRYKFHLAFENLNIGDYVTEKILDPLVARTVPIYWGSRSVKKELGEGSYINVADFDTLDRAVDFVKKLDGDDERYLQLLCQRASLPYTYDEWCDRLLDFMVHAIEHGDRTFSTIMNKTYLEKLHFRRVHSGPIGKLYRAHMRVYSFLRNFRSR